MVIGEYWQILILAIAISVDGFGVGLTYGLRGIKLGLLPLLVISGISTLAIYLTGCIGTEIAGMIGASLAEYLGGFFLIAMGGWLVYSAYFNYNKTKFIFQEELLFSFKIKPLGIMIKILKEPIKADFDCSGTINHIEAVILGLALALDALGAGLGVGLAGCSSLVFPLAIGVFNFLFITCGFFIGERAGDILPKHFELFPGLIIIIFGVIKLI